MSVLTISADKSHFLEAGRPFFYLADTVWSAFTNAQPEEWAEYLDYRRAQGFTALQINILPQWDRSQGASFPEPFKKGKDGRWDFGAPREEYFHSTRELAAMARERDFVPALVFLWCNYVEGTWGAERLGPPQILLEEVDGFAAFVNETFGALEPIYLVSGDTDFKAPVTRALYLEALRRLKHYAPKALTTFHLNPDVSLPDEIVEMEELDFYMYQSGHHPESQDRSYKLAAQGLGYPVKRPVLNGEPCYEGIQYFQQYGRFSSFDVRRAIWQSLLSGASAGVTYGAHGLWSWHRPGLRFGAAQFWNEPFHWRDALHLEGAWDAAFARSLFLQHGLFDLVPAQEEVDAVPEIRLARSADGAKVALYVPYAAEVKLRQDLSGLEWTAISLQDRNFRTPRVRAVQGGSTVEMLPVNGDALFLGAVR